MVLAIGSLCLQADRDQLGHRASKSWMVATKVGNGLEL